MTKKHEQERGIALHFTLHNPQGKLTHTTKSRYKLRHHGTVFLGHLSLVLLLISNLTNGLLLHQFLVTKSEEANKSVKTDANGAY